MLITNSGTILAMGSNKYNKLNVYINSYLNYLKFLVK